MPTKSPDVIYRYQPLRPDAIDLIRTGRLWFSDPSRFNDPFDFQPDFSNEPKRMADQSREAAFWGDRAIRGGRENFFKATQKQRDDLVREACLPLRKPFLRKLAKAFRVACFFEIKDGILMWSHYASYHTGVCFGIRPLQMRLAPEKALRWKVDYRDERLPIEHPEKNEIALRKAEAWKYEKEWRVVMATEDLTRGNRPLPRTPMKLHPEPGYFLKLQWDAIESVRFGALVNRKKRSRIMKVLQAEELRHIQAIQMHLSVDRFALEEEIFQQR
jgi:hypothetical protein